MAPPVPGFAVREVRLGDASSVVHEHVQAAELLLGEGDPPARVGLGSHVGAEERRPSNPNVYLADRAGPRLLVHVRDHDGGFLSGKPYGHRATYPRSPARHEGDLTANLHRVPPASPPALASVHRTKPGTLSTQDRG
jgi:hypothetical protein